MANAYQVTIRSASTDGTNIFLEVEVFDGLHTLPLLRPSFAVGTSAATINSYLQTIANNQPALDSTIGALMNVPILGQ